MKASDARILLTGASGGIGKAAAVALARAGAALMLVGRLPSTLSALADELATSTGAAPTRLQPFVADLTRTIDIEALSCAAAAWGANVVVHAAGLPSFGSFESLPATELQHVLQTNLLAPMLLTQALLPHLRGQPRAQVLCVGSALGGIGLPGFSVYSASKFGLRGFAEALRRELADTTVRVQYLGPRSTRTAFNDAGVEAYNRATGSAMDPPEAVAEALLDLLEDEAAEHFVGFPESLAVRLNGVAPALLDRLFAQHRRSLPTSARAAIAHSPTTSPAP